MDKSILRRDVEVKDSVGIEGREFPKSFAVKRH